MEESYLPVSHRRHVDVEQGLKRITKVVNCMNESSKVQREVDDKYIVV